MLTHAQTLKEQLCTAIERHGLAEVLDRLAELTHASHIANRDEITKHLEDACHLALVEEDVPPVSRPLSLAS